MLGPVGQVTYRDYAADIHKSGTRLLSVINECWIWPAESGTVTIEAGFAADSLRM